MKDEIKLTVVATGFDSHYHDRDKSAPREEPRYTPNSFIIEKEREERLEEKKPSKSKISPLKAAQAEPVKNNPDVDDDEEEGELGIPAFIRRKMK
jgi:hypothetical protein